MVVRTNILPKTLADAAVTGFMFFIIPLVYYFELFVVMPKFYVQWTGTYMFHFVTGTFILWNICSNLMSIIMSDTSIKGRLLPSAVESNWGFCSVCESLVPPRSWHCNTCNICILKRDHHCLFTSCCIGYFNHRYFMVFVLYMFIATTYSSFYNYYFVVEFIEFGSWRTIVRLVFPLFTLLTLDFSWKQTYLFLCLIILIGALFTGVLLYFHLNLIMRGVVTHERSTKNSKYDLGKMENIIDVFGRKWYLTWISAFVKSDLPRDGIQWDTKSSSKAK